MDNNGELLLKCYSDLDDKIIADKVDVTDKSFNFVYELIKSYDKKFIDSKDTVPRFKFDAGGEDRKFGSLNIF